MFVAPTRTFARIVRTQPLRAAQRNIYVGLDLLSAAYAPPASQDEIRKTESEVAELESKIAQTEAQFDLSSERLKQELKQTQEDYQTKLRSYEYKLRTERDKLEILSLSDVQKIAYKGELDEVKSIIKTCLIKARMQDKSTVPYAFECTNDKAIQSLKKVFDYYNIKMGTDYKYTNRPIEELRFELDPLEGNAKEYGLKTRVVTVVYLHFPTKLPSYDLSKLQKHIGAQSHSEELQKWLADFDADLRLGETQSIEMIAAEYEKFKKQLFDVLDENHPTAFINDQCCQPVFSRLSELAAKNNISLKSDSNRIYTELKVENEPAQPTFR